MPLDQQIKPTRERLPFDTGWLFHHGDVPMPVIRGHGPTYENAKAGKAWGAATPDFDDSDWRVLDLPHDWVVEGPFDPEENISQGYRPRGVAWYRRHFRLEESDRARHLEMQFDGIATHATVWVNGLLMHRNFCGYTPFAIDLTPIATFGDQLNTVAVRVDADVQEGWWYEGGGIYRHTWLLKRAPVHIAIDGVYAVPVRDEAGQWTVPVEITLDNFQAASASVTVGVELTDHEARPIVSDAITAEVLSFQSGVARLTVAFPGQPELWSPDYPALYCMRATVSRDGQLLDEHSIPCGFRTLRFDPNHGFFLNDQPLKIQGTCNHQDHAGLGVAVPAALWDFRVRRLKELGSNACRCAHHPPAPEFLDACDRLGLMVMDENRHFNHTPEYLAQLRSLVRRDRNHPSVILWSVFNEEPMQGTTQGREMVRRMGAEIRRLDTTRPITAAMNGGMMNEHGVFEAVDVMGFNYCDHAYDAFHAKHPRLPMLSSEDTCGFMTRGEFTTDPARNVIASYDAEWAVWGRNHRKAWQLIAERPFLAGGFVWTGFDYRGEPQRLSWPSVSSVFGSMDTCGFPKTAYFIHQAEWVKNHPVLAIAPHWNWPGHEGRLIRVLVMTNAQSAELFLNGVPLGRKDRPPFDVIEWDVPYAPGSLEAVSYVAGRENARAIVETTGLPSAIRLVPDRDWLAGDGRDAQPVTVSVVDDQDRVVPGANDLVTFTISGPAENIGHGNGDHNCHDPEHGPCRRVFHGLGQLIVRSRTDSGIATIRAEAGFLKAAELRLEVRSVPPFPSVPAALPAFSVASWRVSPPQDARPDPNIPMNQADMNTWAPVIPGNLQVAPPGHWLVYRAVFTPWRAFTQGGTLKFGLLHGTAEVWLDGRKVGEKTHPEPAVFQTPLPSGPAERVLTLLARPAADNCVGLADVVRLDSQTKEEPSPASDRFPPP